MLEVNTLELQLVFHGEGRSLPWLGMALRGTVAQHFKDSVCQYPPGERLYCRGCPHIHECPYGVLIEPEPQAMDQAWRGQEDLCRPLVLAPAFPAPETFFPGDRLPVRLTVIERAATSHTGAFLASFAKAGVLRGLGPNRVPFQLQAAFDSACSAALRPEDLPAQPDVQSACVPRVEVELKSPLFLKPNPTLPADGPGPSFEELLRACLRVVGSMFRAYGEPLPANFRALKEAAQGVATLENGFEPFLQPVASRRHEHRYRKAGVIGSAVFGPVPLALLPWLIWGGRLHAGSYRVAGAGGWRVALS